MTRFVKGQSGNPGGRPKGLAEIQTTAREHCPAAIQVLAAAMNSADDRIKIAAAQALLDRGYGRPAQAIVGGSDQDEPAPLLIVTGVRRHWDDDEEAAEPQANQSGAL